MYSATVRLSDHPRIRGEHNGVLGRRGDDLGSSPHTRGAQPLFLAERRDHRIIPAYAGSTLSGGRRGAAEPDHPRIRGEHIESFVWSHAASGSSPHTRGARPVATGALRHRGIIPAYAGSTWTRSRSGSASGDHPRIRGEHFPEPGFDVGQAGSSPHTRGAHVPRHGHHREKRIIPAYAGSTPIAAKPDNLVMGSSPHTRGAHTGRTGWRPLVRDHPRIRGEHAGSRSGPMGGAGSSPHTRGARVHQTTMTTRRGIIPAYAGSTRPTRRQAGYAPDHPRIRGEHGPPRSISTSQTGSSPHTRGALSDAWRHWPVSGIIPAYAGSTRVRAR